MKFLQFEPLYKERVWGGRRLEESLGRKLPNEGLYGESWDLVDREDDQSIVEKGKWEGLTLRQLLEIEGHYIMGPAWPKEKRFPILVKWLDCRERLSLQVHPPKEVACLLNGESKTENWYIAERDAGASVFAGVREGTNAEDFLKGIEGGGVEEFLGEISTEKGDSLFIPSGRLHAIGGGNLILEIQENSDTTYRVYDWGRVGLDGKPRDMHLEESMASIDFLDTDPEKVTALGKSALLTDCQEFRIRQLTIKPAETFEIAANEEPRIISVVEGELRIGDKEGRVNLKRGANILLPFGEGFFLESKEGTKILITDRFV